MTIDDDRPPWSLLIDGNVRDDIFASVLLSSPQTERAAARDIGEHVSRLHSGAIAVARLGYPWTLMRFERGREVSP